MALVVQKYGGSSVATAERIRRVAERIDHREIVGGSGTIIAAVDANDNERIDLVRGDELRSRFVHMPPAAARFGIAVAEKILSVVQIEDGISSVSAESRRQPDTHGTDSVQRATLEVDDVEFADVDCRRCGDRGGKENSRQRQSIHLSDVARSSPTYHAKTRSG